MTSMIPDLSKHVRARRRDLWSATPFKIAAIALVALAFAACSSSSSTPTTTSTSTPPATLPPASVSKADIEHAYSTLFDLADPAVPPKLLVVQDGSSLKAAFTAAIHSALAKEAAGAKVLSVTVHQGSDCSAKVLPSPCATVIYDILGSNKQPVLTGSAGSAVYVSGTWLVAKSTICTLLTLDNGGSTPSGC
jgi:hypothetical protein